VCKQKKKAFTLIELLVVIAIIALLMSILMPALRKIRVQAKTSICMSNLHEWALIFNMYTGENDGFFGEGWYPGGLEHQWMKTLKKHYQTEEMLLCPAATIPMFDIGPGGGILLGPGYNNNKHAAWGRFPPEGLWDDIIDGYENAIGSYGLNEWISNVPYGSGDDYYQEEIHWRSTYVRKARQIPVLSDCWWMGGFPTPWDEPVDYTTEMLWSPEIARYTIDRHDGSINMVFVDYSVKRVGLRQLWQLQWSKEYVDGTTIPAWGNPDIVPDPENLEEWPEWMQRLKNYDLGF
jgi:prepilin-type N-terminal cleavage/methylation domain-containing protein